MCVTFFAIVSFGRGHLSYSLSGKSDFSLRFIHQSPVGHGVKAFCLSKTYCLCHN